MNPTQQLRPGIAIARRNYKAYRDLLASPRWLNAFHSGAQPQSLIRASTGTKCPQAPDVLYVNILRHADAGKRQRTSDAETAPVRHPGHYPYDLHLPDIDSPDPARFAGRLPDSGEGRWTIAAAIDESVPAPVLSAALYERFRSRGESDFGDKVLSALRYRFGGNEEKAATKAGA